MTDAPLSPWQIGWRRLRHNRLAMAAGWVLVLLHGAALFADFLAPYPEGPSNREKFFHPPTAVRLFDAQGRLSWPFVYNHRLVDVGTMRYEPDPAQGKFPIRLFHRGSPYRLFWLFPSDIHLFGVDQPAVIYWLGADRFGRDILSRLIHGARKSLFIGIVGISITSVLGLIYGGMSGFYGGRLDNALMRLAEVVLAAPAFFLLLFLAAVLPMSFPSSWRFFFITVIISLISWPGLARVIRGLVLSIGRQEFVEAARAIGCSHARIIVRHILPNTLSYAVAYITLAIPGFILAESSLSLIGVGVHEPEASWGNMLSDALNLVALSRFPWILAPGACIFVAVLSWALFGDGVRDAFDPRTAQR